MDSARFSPLAGRSPGFYALLALLGAVLAAGLWAAHVMESQGHYVTGMDNQVVWGMPHVFAVFLIVAASGALNVASIASVFGRLEYKPLARLSALLAVALLIGGLAVLVLDLGRPDRLIVAMTYYNFRSIFAWNILLYTGFVALVAVYLWLLMERRMNRYSTAAGYLAFAWRLILTTGTGSIFGFLVARQAYDAALMAPLFVIMSFSYGLAVFLLVLLAAFAWSGRPLGEPILQRLKNLLAIFVVAVLYFVLVFNLTNLYAAEHHGIERFLLLDGEPYAPLFWWGQVGLGSLLPLALFWLPGLARSRAAIAAGSLLVVLGGMAQLYVIIIGGQAYPLVLFADKDVRSRFFDGVVASYAPSVWEVMLGLGGVALALLILTLGARVLSLLPERLGEARPAPPVAAAADDHAPART